MEEKGLDIKLNRIGRAKAPEGLLQSIHARIDAERQQRVPMIWVVGIAASLLLLISLNISALGRSDAEENASRVPSLETQFSMDTSNQLYDE